MNENTGRVPVVIVGAGPTGLTLACLLAGQGIEVRVVDRRQGPSTRSKAVVLWSRTLEVFDALGVASAVRQRGLPMTMARYSVGSRLSVELPTGRIPGTRQAPVVLPQNVTETLLLETLTALGGRVSWGVEVAGVDQDAGRVMLSARDENGRWELIEADYAVGCDGLHSIVREQLGVGWHGSAFEEVFVLGDVTATSKLDRLGAHHFLGRDGFVIMVPLPANRWRIVGAGRNLPDGPPTATDLQRLVDSYAGDGNTVHLVEWSDVFRITRRLAENLRAGRVLLAGDAAHVHSPAGGQGLNTGIQDAHNLAWKLAFVLRHGADPGLLDSYSAERRPVAEQVLRITDTQAKFLFLAQKPVARLVRRLLLRGMRTERVRGRLLPRIAQLTVDYATSPLTGGSSGRAATARPGLRVPDVDVTVAGGSESVSLLGLCAPDKITVVETPGSDNGIANALRPFATVVNHVRLTMPLPGDAGNDYLLAVRPDGHIGYRGPAGDIPALLSWLTAAVRLPITTPAPEGVAHA